MRNSGAGDYEVSGCVGILNRRAGVFRVGSNVSEIGLRLRVLLEHSRGGKHTQNIASEHRERQRVSGCLRGEAVQVRTSAFVLELSMENYGGQPSPLNMRSLACQP